MTLRRWVAAFLFALAALAPGAALSQSGEPYTARLPDDVWGVKLPLPEGAFGNIDTLHVYVDRQGDVIVPYFFSLPNVDGKKMAGWRFFSLSKGEVIKDWSYTRFERDTVYEDFAAEKHLRPAPPIDVPVHHWSDQPRLPDGGWLLAAFAAQGRCYIPIGDWLIKVDSSGQEVLRRMIVRISEEPRQFFTTTSCRIMDDRDIGYVRSQSILPEVYDLGDGTYLVKEMWGPFVIRFDEDWQSPFFDASNELLLVDEELALRIYDKGSRLAQHAQREAAPGEVVFLLETADAYVTERFRALLDEQRRAQ